MASELEGIRVAILATDGFELSELTEPKRALEEAGADVDVLAPAKSSPSRKGSDCPDDEIQGFKHHSRSGRVRVDKEIADADPDDYDAVHLPGGVINADALRIDKDAQQFVQAFATEKPLGVICHGPWLLISAGLMTIVAKSPIGGFLPTLPFIEPTVATACMATAALVGVASAFVPAFSASRMPIVQALRTSD